MSDRGQRQNEYLVETAKAGNFTVKTQEHHDDPSWSHAVARALHQWANNQNFKDATSALGGITGIVKAGEMAREYLTPKKANEVEHLLKQILEEMRRRPPH